MKTIHTWQVLFEYLQLQRAVASSTYCHLATKLQIIQISQVRVEIQHARILNIMSSKYTLFNINLGFDYSITNSNIYVTLN